MKSLPLSILLTTVCFILVTHLNVFAQATGGAKPAATQAVPGQAAGKPAPVPTPAPVPAPANKPASNSAQPSSAATSEECILLCNEKFSSSGDQNASELSDCKSKICSIKPSSGVLSQKCSSAYQKYTELASKEKIACGAFDKASTGSGCIDKVNSCRKKMTSLFTPIEKDTPEETAQSGADQMHEVVMTSLKTAIRANTAKGKDTTIAGTASCIKSIDKNANKQQRKDKKTEEKELKSRRDKLKDDTLALSKEIDSEKEKNKKETAEIEAEFKKEMLSKDTKIREGTANAAKASLETSKRIRGYSTALSQELQKLATINFEFQAKMLPFSDDKIKKKCQQSFETAKASVVSSATATPPGPNATPEQLKNYESSLAIANMYKSKGIKGSGDLKKILLQTKKDCLTDANTEKNRLQMTNAQTVKAVQDKVEELNSMISDEKKNIALEDQNIKKIQDEIGTEKSNAEKDKLTRLQNISDKEAAFIKNINDKIKELTARKLKIDEDIQNLSLVEAADVEESFNDAETAIESSRLARLNTLDNCSCDSETAQKPNYEFKNICNTLKRGEDLYKSTIPDKAPEQPKVKK